METIVLEVGNQVLCDLCNKDWTDSNTTGGFLRGSYAVCPDCAPDHRAKLKEFNEEHHIRAECPVFLSFADWVRNYLR